jgi:predicted methyltransferase
MRRILCIFSIMLVAGCHVSTVASTPSGHLSQTWRAPSPLFDPALADSLLESPDRAAWQKPRQIIDALGIRKGMTVADVGAGSGFLLPALSRAVGPSGKVYAQEIQDAFVSRLRRRAKTLHNVQVVRGTADDPRLPAAIDRLVLLTVYHEVQNPVAFLKKLKRCAGPESTLAIIDFDAARRGNPPAPPGHEMAESAVLAEAESAGWRLVRKHEFLSSQFFLIFAREESLADGGRTDG